jgi:hypothetical protein
VSRVLTLPENEHGCMHADSLGETTRSISALVLGSQNPWLRSAPDMAGFRVHSGTATGCDMPEIPLPILEYLAYILASYEEIISSLHSDSAADTVIRTATYTPLPISWASKATATAAVNFFP